MIRTIKILLGLSVAGVCLVYGLQNLANLDAALGAVGHVMGRVDQSAYPDSILPPITSPLLIKVGLGLILVGEFSAGLMALKGTWDLWTARGKSASEFHQAKRWIQAAGGVAILTWFGLFHVIGGALFQQWQTVPGDGSLNGAFWLAGSIALIILYITQTDD